MQNPVVNALMPIFINRGEDIIKKHPELTKNSSPEKDYFIALKEILNADNLYAVILGQDPYPQPNTATGIAFANKADKQVISPSLKVIKESISTITQNETFDVTLNQWVKQGILPINSSWTVPYNNPNEHWQYWVRYTADLLKDLSTRVPNLCYILLGNQASMFRRNIVSGKILEEYHPSFYIRTKQQMPPRVWLEMLSYVKDTFKKELVL